LDAKAVFAPKTHHRDRPVPRDDRSISEKKTYAGKIQQSDPVSLGDQGTFVNEPSQDLSVIGSTDLSQRYLIESTIGHGGMGEVHLATDTRLKRKVAIKRIKNQSTNNATLLRRFLTEAQSIAQLNHYHIVQVYDYGHDTQGPYLVLEYVDGGTLADKLKSGPMPIEDGIRIICQVCDGLIKAHAAGIIHRDIKPANILLTADGVPKLADFGLARVENFDSGHTMAGSVLGTLDFMSPEQRLDIKLTDERSDLWSLAAVLYQLVTGRSPKTIYVDNLPVSLREILLKSLEEGKDQRYQSAIEFRNALSQANLAQVQDLNEGECPNCLTKNDPNRRFCRKCAGSLVARCLSCDEKVPVWEEVCDNCGVRQSLLLSEIRQKMSSEQIQAEGLLNNYDFDKALSIVKSLRDQSDPRLMQHKLWAEQFATKVELERAKSVDYVDTLMSLALAYEKTYDYESGLREVEKVPQNLRDVFSESHNTKLKDIEELLKERIKFITSHRTKMINDKISAEILLSNNLAENAIEAAFLIQKELHPSLYDIKEWSIKFVSEAITKRDEQIKSVSVIFKNALELEKRFEYESSLQILAQIPEECFDLKIPGCDTTVRIAKSRVAKNLETLNTIVDRNVSDSENIISNERPFESDSESCDSLAHILNIAQDARLTGVKSWKIGLSDNIRNLETDIQQLRQDSLERLDELASIREFAMSSLIEAKNSKEYQKGIDQTRRYLLILNDNDLEDIEFANARNDCYLSLKSDMVAQRGKQKTKESGSFLLIIAIAISFVVVALFMQGSLMSLLENAK